MYTFKVEAFPICYSRQELFEGIPKKNRISESLLIIFS